MTTAFFYLPAFVLRIGAVRSAVLNRPTLIRTTSIELNTALQTIGELRNSKIPFNP
jgi:hypothetical protein